MIISTQCQYCLNEKKITADSNQWKIHLAGHRKDIIHELSKYSSDCMIFPCSSKFSNQVQAIHHYRYFHKRGDIVKWAFFRLAHVFVPGISRGNENESRDS